MLIKKRIEGLQVMMVYIQCVDARQASLKYLAEYRNKSNENHYPTLPLAMTQRLLLMAGN
jgi:hypothetical protein